MDKLLIRKDVYEDLIEKGYGKRDLSKLTKKQITDKNGHKRTVYVRNGEQPVTQNQPKAQNELSPEKKVRYEEMLEKVKAGSDENALFVKDKGMLNKKDAIAYLSEKLGKKTVNSAYEGHLESDNPPNTDITKEDEERFGKQALSGLSGKRTNSEEKKEPSSLKDELEESKTIDFKTWLEDNDIVPEEMASESYGQILKMVKKTGLNDEAAVKITDDIIAYNKEAKANIYKKVEFTPKEMKAIREEAKRINYKPGMENSLLIALKNRNDGTSGSLYFKNREIWNETGMVKDTNSDYDLIKKKIKSMNGDFGTDESKESETKKPKPSIQDYMKAKDSVKKLEEAYKKQKDAWDYTQRLKENGIDTTLMFPMNVKPKELSDNEDYIKAKETISLFED